MFEFVRRKKKGKKGSTIKWMRRKQETWTVKQFATAVLPESLSSFATIKRSQWVLEQDKEEFKSPENPHGAGPYFGYFMSDTVDEKGMAMVTWLDGQDLSIPLVNCCLCPAEKSSVITKRDKKTGMRLKLTVIMYMKKGVNLYVQKEAGARTAAGNAELGQPATRDRAVAAARQSRAAVASESKSCACTISHIHTFTHACNYTELSTADTDAESGDETESGDDRTNGMAPSAELARNAARKHAPYAARKRKAATAARKKQKSLKVTPVKGNRVQGKDVVQTQRKRRKRSKRGRCAMRTASDDEAARADDEKDAKDGTDPSKWARCTRPYLPQDLAAKLKQAFYFKRTHEVDLHDFSISEYHMFLDRVVREYLYHWDTTKDGMHLNREKYIEDAIATVFSQLRPETCLPHKGDMDEALEAVQPFVEKTLEMPPGLARGSDAWLKERLQKNDYTFPQCSVFQQLYDHWCDTRKKKCDKNGLPTLLPGTR